MKLSTYHEELLKNISSVETRKELRSILKDQQKVISKSNMILGVMEEYSSQYPKAKDYYASEIKSAQKRILEIEQKLVQGQQ